MLRLICNYEGTKRTASAFKKAHIKKKNIRLKISIKYASPSRRKGIFVRQELESLSPVSTCWFQTYRNLEDAAVLVRSAQRETLVTHGLPRLVPPGTSMLLPPAPSLFPTHQRHAIKIPITESPSTLSNALSWQVGSLWALTQCKAIAGVFATNHLNYSSQQAMLWMRKQPPL